jgi:hypothetical protein
MMSLAPKHTKEENCVTVAAGCFERLLFKILLQKYWHLTIQFTTMFVYFVDALG